MWAKQRVSLCTPLLAWTLGLLAMTCASAPPAWAQAVGQVSGTVTSPGGQPLQGARVVVGQTDRGAITGADGRYALANVPAGPVTLRATLLGYSDQAKTATVTAGGTATLDFELAPQAVMLEGVVAVGYGTQRRRDVTGAVGSVSAEDLEKSQKASVVQALQGRVAGVSVQTSSAAPGGGASVRVRGSGSITSGSEPLYVIDGVPLYNNNNEDDPLSGQSAERRVSGNALAFLNPNDIESIQVLKDASSTAIYGARGSNGVVIVTTKRGRSGGTVVEVESSLGTQEATRRVALLDATEYAEFINEWSTLTRGRTIFENPASFGAGTDWQDLILRSAPVAEYNMTIRGGAEQTRFALSGNVADQQGIVRGSSFQRYSFRANVDHRLNQRFNVGTNVTAARVRFDHGLSSEGGGRRQSSAISAALAAYPLNGVRNEEGVYLRNDRNAPAGLAGIVTGRNYENPVAAIEEATDDQTQDRLFGNAFVEYDVVPGLQLRLNGGADIRSNSRSEYFTRNSMLGEGNGRAVAGNVNVSNYLLESIARLNRRYGVHHLDVTAGATLEQQDEVRRAINTGNFVSDATGANDLGAGTPTGGPGVGSGREEWTLLSYLGRAQYSLRDRYILTLTGRADGSSKFGENNKWGFFPSVAAAYRLSEEPFMQGAGFLSDLKLRASYGQTGNQEIPVYRSLAQLGNVQYPIGGGSPVAGVVPARVANPDLRWERSTQWDAGLDGALFDGRVTFSADLYRKNTEDLLLNVVIPAQSGFTSALQNFGRVENRGVELALGADLVDRGDFLWKTNFNYAANRNRAGAGTNVDGGAITTSFPASGSKVIEGQPIGVFFGYKSDGILRDQAAVDAYCALVPRVCANASARPIPGQLRIRDVDGDGNITSADRTVLGSPHPDFSLGLSNDFRFRGVSLYVFMQGSFGQEVYNVNLEEIAAIQADPGLNLFRDRWTNRWTEQNPGGSWPIITLPAGRGARGAGFNESDDPFIEDASFLRLQNVTLTFELPGAVRRNRLVAMRSGQVFLAAENVHTWTRYSGYNPDVNSGGGDNINRGYDLGAYPLARTLRIGLRLGL